MGDELRFWNNLCNCFLKESLFCVLVASFYIDWWEEMWRLRVGSLGLILTKNLLLCFWRHFGQEPRQLLTTGSWFSASISSATLEGSLVRTYSMNISLSRLASEWQDLLFESDDLSTSLISYSLCAIVDFEFVNAPRPALSASSFNNIAGSSWNAPLFPRALSLTEDSTAELDCSRF